MWLAGSTTTDLDRYMSKAPGAAADYDGSGPWFKTKDWGTFRAVVTPPLLEALTPTDH